MVARSFPASALCATPTDRLGIVSRASPPRLAGALHPVDERGAPTGRRGRLPRFRSDLDAVHGVVPVATLAPLL